MSTPVRFGKLVGKNTAVNKGGQPIIGKKRMEALKKASANYNRRAKRKLQKYFGEVSWEAANKYRRAEGRLVTDVDISSIKTVKDYNAMIKWLNRDKTKAYKAEKTADRRDWMSTMLQVGYEMNPEDFPELFDLIEHMSGDQILLWQLSYPQLVKDSFRHYKTRDRATRDSQWIGEMQQILDSITEVTGVQLPSARAALGLE